MQSFLSFFQLDKAGAIPHDVLLTVFVGLAVTYGGRVIDFLWAKLTGMTTERSKKQRDLHTFWVGYYNSNPHLIPLINSQLIALSLSTFLSFGLLAMFTWFDLYVERFAVLDKMPITMAMLLAVLVVCAVPLFHSILRINKLMAIVRDLGKPEPKPDGPKPETPKLEKSAILERIDRKLSQRAYQDK